MMKRGKGTILEMRNVTKRFPGVTALDHVSIDLKHGEILGVCGENGAGKSTLMKVLSGSYSAEEYEGDILIDGQKMKFSCVEDAQKAGIEMVYQEINMMLDLSIAENLYVGNLPRKKGFLDYSKLYADTQQILDTIKMNLDPRGIVRPLNSGQMQMLSIMRARVKNPKILVLDEPTTALTDQEVYILFQILNKLKEEGVSCIYISHKLPEIYRICDRVVVIRDGHTISNHPIAEVEEQTLIEEMVGRKVENMYPKTAAKIGKEILKVEHLSVPHPTIPGKNIVEDISFTLRKGEILGIGGLVGAGRSELLGAIFGEIDKGVKKEITLNEKKITIHQPKDAINHGFGYITEERKLTGIIWMLSIRDNMSLASLKKYSGRLFMKAKQEQKDIDKVFSDLRIKAPSVRTKLIQLSGGNQQKVILGKWLLNSPQILLVDEPTKGIDVGTKADFYRIMCQLADSGVSIIMVSSDMPELLSMSDRVLVIAGGKITAQLEGEEMTNTNVMRAAIAN